MYVRPRVDGEPLTFGVSGRLWRDSLVMFDRSTRSLWSQVLGKAFAGPLSGRVLEEVPSAVTSWGEWKRSHPETLVLAGSGAHGSAYARYHEDPAAIEISDAENPDPRLPAKSLVFGMRRDDRAAAVPFEVLERSPVLNTNAFGVPVVVLSPPGEKAAMAYVREAGGRVLSFERAPAEGERLAVRDAETGSAWVWETGECVQGPLTGEELERISGLPAYWGIWARFHPGAEVVGGPGGGSR